MSGTCCYRPARVQNCDLKLAALDQMLRQRPLTNISYVSGYKALHLYRYQSAYTRMHRLTSTQTQLHS